MDDNCTVTVTVCRLFMVKSSREEAMYSTRVVVDIIECLNHRSAAIRNKAYKMCEIGK